MGGACGMGPHYEHFVNIIGMGPEYEYFVSRKSQTKRAKKKYGSGVRKTLPELIRSCPGAAPGTHTGPRPHI